MTAYLNDPRLPARFWSKVEVDQNGCWLWTAAIRPKGYAFFRPKGPGTCLAHRAAYIALVGRVPHGLQLDHLCRVRRCVNPDHLEPVTQSVNMLRALEHRNRRKTHCPHGHAYDDANTLIRQDNGGRICLACREARNAARRAARRHHRNAPDAAARPFPSPGPAAADGSDLPNAA